MNENTKDYSIVLLKFIAALLITYSHMGNLFPYYGGLVTGGAIGDGLFFFCSGFTLFLGRNDGFFNWYKRRVTRIYPSIWMWGLIVSVFCIQKWEVVDLITVPRYWFISCILFYYVILFFIRKYMMAHLKLSFIIASLIICIASFYILDLENSVMYAQVSFMKWYYFLFMLMGAIVALNPQRENKPLKFFGYFLICIIFYYICMAIYKIGPLYCRFQIVSLVPLLFAIYWLYKFCCTEWSLSIFQKKYVGKIIYWISALTLQIYLVQYVLFTEKYNNVFPLNLLLTYLVIFIMSYILKCASQFFVQLFAIEKINWEKVIKL